MPTGRLQDCKSKAKSNNKKPSFCCWCHIINNVITLTVWLLQENLKPWLTILTWLSLGQYGKASVWDFALTTSLDYQVVSYKQIHLLISKVSEVESKYLETITWCYRLGTVRQEWTVANISLKKLLLMSMHRKGTICSPKNILTWLYMYLFNSSLIGKRKKQGVRTDGLKWGTRCNSKYRDYSLLFPQCGACFAL